MLCRKCHDPDNSATHTSYYPTGLVKAQWGSQTYPTLRVYNGQGQLTTLYTYQALTGEPVNATGAAATTWNYSPTTGQLLSKHDATGLGPSYTHTPAGRLKSRLWARGKYTRYDYNYACGGRLYAMRHFTTAEAGLANDGNDPGDDPNTGDVTFLYNRLGQTTQTVTACNATSGRPGIRVATDFDPNSFSATRDIIQIDPDLVSTTSDGDSDPTLQRVLHRAYESAGAGRPLGYSLRHTTAANSTVDATTTYGYSTTGRLETVSSNPLGGTTTTSGFAYGYLSNSNLIETVRSYLSGTTGTPIHSVTNTYESARDVLDKKTNTNGFTNVEISATEYTVNNLGQRDGVTRTGAGTAAPASANASYAYNSRGELVEDNEASAVADRAYQYNDIGNREKAITGVFSDLATASANYASNPLNQYTRANNVTLPAGSYDLDGNLLSGPVGASPSNSATLVWDGENRLITATVGSTTVSYIYDGLSRRVARTVGTARTFYIYDGWNCVAEYGGSVPTSGAPTANAYPGFVHTWGIDISGTMQGAGGVGGLLASTKLTAANAGTTYYPLFDGNGNITSYIDSSRNVQAYFNYDPFGNQIDNSYSNPIGLSYAFSTKAFDTDTGLYYYGYRWYDPLTGRWPSRDPMGERGFETLRAVAFMTGALPGRGGYTVLGNYYNFCWNSPPNLADADGEWIIAVAFYAAVTIYAIVVVVEKLVDMESRAPEIGNNLKKALNPPEGDNDASRRAGDAVKDGLQRQIEDTGVIAENLPGGLANGPVTDPRTPSYITNPTNLLVAGFEGIRAVKMMKAAKCACKDAEYVRQFKNFKTSVEDIGYMWVPTRNGANAGAGYLRRPPGNPKGLPDPSEINQALGELFEGSSTQFGLILSM